MTIELAGEGLPAELGHRLATAVRIAAYELGSSVALEEGQLGSTGRR